MLALLGAVRAFLAMSAVSVVGVVVVGRDAACNGVMSLCAVCYEPAKDVVLVEGGAPVTEV